MTEPCSWQCPGCKTYYHPSVLSCFCEKDKKSEIRYMRTRNVPCAHRFTMESTSTGRICELCGMPEQVFVVHETRTLGAAVCR